MVSRTTLTDSDIANTSEPTVEKADSYSEQILKYIPAEVVAFYLPTLEIASRLPGGITTDTSPHLFQLDLLWSPYGIGISLTFLVALIATYFYIRKSAQKNLEDKKVYDSSSRARIKAGITTVAFFIWALFIGGIFQYIIPFHETIGTLGILFFTLISPPLYEYLANWLTLSPGIIVEYSHTTSQNTPPRTNPDITVTNNTAVSVTVTSIALYWKRRLFGDTLESITPINLTIPSNKDGKINESLRIMKEGVTHVLKIRTDKMKIATSKPFKDKPPSTLRMQEQSVPSKPVNTRARKITVTHRKQATAKTASSTDQPDALPVFIQNTGTPQSLRDLTMLLAYQLLSTTTTNNKENREYFNADDIERFYDDMRLTQSTNINHDLNSDQKKRKIIKAPSKYQRQENSSSNK